MREGEGGCFLDNVTRHLHAGVIWSGFGFRFCGEACGHRKTTSSVRQLC